MGGLEGSDPNGLLGNVELECISEDDEMASQSSMLELTGVRALRILCAPDSIVRKVSWETVLFCVSSGRVERRRRTEHISHSQVPPADWLKGY